MPSGLAMKNWPPEVYATIVPSGETEYPTPAMLSGSRVISPVLRSIRKVSGPVPAGGVAGPVSVPPGTAGVWVRSDDPTDVTIQTAATNTAIPTTPAAMRWFRRLRSRRR